MSIIKAGKVQAGISLTPANNFILDASADDGTVILKRADGTEVLSVDASGNLIGKGVNPVDQTSNRLLEFGDFGVGYGIPKSGVSLDTLTIPGVYTIDATCTNRPPEAHSEVTLPLYVHSNNDRVIQMAYQGHSEIVSWIRIYNTVNWGSWRRVFNQGSILGAVSQSEGVPTGAIIEAGSNEKGEYTKFADGTLVMISPTTVIDLTDTSVKAVPLYPATFVGTRPATSVSSGTYDGKINQLANVGVGSGSGGWTYHVAVAGLGETSVRFLAIGRWF
jgi:hypothetical protein